MKEKVCRIGAKVLGTLGLLLALAAFVGAFTLVVGCVLLGSAWLLGNYAQTISLVAFVFAMIIWAVAMCAAAYDESERLGWHHKLEEKCRRFWG